MPQVPKTLNLRIPELKRAKESMNVKEFMEKVIAAFEELDRYWPILRSDVERAE